MKLSRFFLIIAWCFCAYKNTAQTGILNLEEYLHASNSPYYYRMENRLSLGDRIFPENYNREEDLSYYDSLPAGEYTLRYWSIFHQAYEAHFTHDGHSVQRLRIYHDDFREDTTAYTLAGDLKPGDTLSIQYYGYGCEPYDGGTLQVIKDAKAGLVRFQQDDFSNRKYNKKKRMQPADERAIIRFERQIRAMENNHNGGSMTFCYEISLNGKVVLLLKYMPVQWDGMAELRRDIFGK